MLQQFARWAIDQLGITGSPKIRYSNDKDQVDSLRTFGSTKPTGEIWVYVGDRNTADALRTLCHELCHYHQFETGTAHEQMTDEQHLAIEDEANALAGRMMRDYGKQHVEIYEGRTGSIQDDVARALPATYVIPELQNNDAYRQYRFGVAIAGAKGRRRREEDAVTRYTAQSAWGENQIVVSYDPDVEEFIDDALKQLGLKGKRMISTRKSEETTDVDKRSPVKAFKGYRRK
jgi:hypothetical protein